MAWMNVIDRITAEHQWQICVEPWVNVINRITPEHQWPRSVLSHGCLWHLAWHTMVNVCLGFFLFPKSCCLKSIHSREAWKVWHSVLFKADLLQFYGVGFVDFNTLKKDLATNLMSSLPGQGQPLWFHVLKPSCSWKFKRAGWIATVKTIFQN